MVCEACDSRAAATADGRFDRIIAHGFENCAHWRGRINRLPPPRLANRTLRTHHANTENWHAH
eukprot:509156-Lingulodinium_polyedra.AAC.1